MKRLFTILALTVVAALSLTLAACSCLDFSAVSGVKMNKRAVTLYEGESTTVIATVQPSTAENKSVSYASSNQAVATVDASGKITAVSVGEANIIATSIDGGFTDTTTVRVIESTISFKTLNFTNSVAQITLSNSIASYDFSSEIELKGKVNYTVYQDEALSSIVLGECQLQVGYNEFYIAHKSSVYKVIIKRLAQYAVSFVSEGLPFFETTVEENSLVTAPITMPTKAGYEFSAWDYNFEAPVTENLTVNAIFTPLDDIPYKVEYFLETLNSEFTLVETVNCVGVTDSVVSPEIKNYENYTCENPSVTAVISANGLTSIEVYYLLNQFTVTFNGGGGTLVSGEETQTVKYGAAAQSPTYEKYGYNLVGFDLEFSEVTEDVTVTAVWQGKEVNYAFSVESGASIVGEATGVIRYGSSTEDILSVTANKTGFDFKGWVINGEPVGEIWNILSENTVEITPSFEVKAFAVLLDVNGGNELTNNVINVIYGEEYVLPTPTCEGKDFISWTVKGGNYISMQGVWLIEEEVELVAVWGTNEFTLTFTQEGCNDVVISVQKGSTYSGEIPRPKAVEGYRVSWDITEQEIRSLTTTTVIRATLTPEVYYISLRLNGGEYEGETEIEVVFGEEYSLPVPTRAGYSFAGWLSSYGSVELTGVWQIADNVTLKATWN